MSEWKPMGTDIFKLASRACEQVFDDYIIMFDDQLAVHRHENIEFDAFTSLFLGTDQGIDSVLVCSKFSTRGTETPVCQHLWTVSPLRSAGKGNDDSKKKDKLFHVSTIIIGLQNINVIKYFGKFALWLHQSSYTYCSR